VGTGSDIKSIRWAFREVADEGFVFHGRVWTTVTTEFDWTPAQVYGARSFVETSDTTAHLLWDGNQWQDLKSTGITFEPFGAPTSTVSPLYNQPYASGLTSGNYWMADFAHGGNAVDTSGNFTVCAKFKPGTHPGDPGVTKILVGKGVPEDADPSGTGMHEGWALMQMHSGYCFHYRTEAEFQADPTDTNPHMSTRIIAPSDPSTFQYDYVCGGRNGDNIQLQALEGVGDLVAVAPFFANSGADLPLVIGAYANGTHPARDAGVYEIIFDRRAATPAVMQEIIERAEGFFATVPALLYPLNDSGATQSYGPDAASYWFPPYATVPLYDATGNNLLMPEGSVRRYLNPVTQNTSSTGFCVGAEIKANAAWSLVQGGVIQYSIGSFGVQFGSGAPGNWRVTGNYLTATSLTAPASWADASVHTIKACYMPGNGLVEPFYPGELALYTDGVRDDAGTAQSYDSLPNLGAAYVPFFIGQNTVGGTTTQLSGARIQRVFVCPTYVAADCN
jgi:hypothetical protein